MLNCLCSPPKAPFFVLSVILTLLYPAGAHEDTRNTIGTDEVGTLFVDGYTRSYLIHTPANASSRPSIVVMLHGRGGTKEQAAKEFGWIELADKEGFLAVFPQALPIIPNLAAGAPTPPSVPSWLGSTNDALWWSSGFVRNLSFLHHPDDGVFIKLLVLKLVVEKHAAPKHIFVAGFSSGGGMVDDLAARFPETIHGFAVVAAVGGLRPAKLTSPISLILFAGDADSTLLDAKRWAYIPDEAKLSWFGQLTLPTLSSEANSWAILNRCQRSINKRVPWGRRTVWTGCVRGSHLEAYLMRDLGHEWPGHIVSRWNQDHATLPPLDLSALIWHFFISTQ
jgi:polyhydroxybutyrate depolymerase